ncbi:MAG TPA: acyl-CoA dehydrogenase [Marmoricola sp.]
MADISADLRADIRGVVGDVLDRGPEAARGTWAACVDAGVTALAAPQEYDGEGLGIAGLDVVVREVAKRAVDLPVWETLGCGLQALATVGPTERKADLIPRIVAGELLISPALDEPGNAFPAVPTTRLEDGHVTGAKSRVWVSTGSTAATLLLVTTDVGVVLIDPDADGITRVDTPSSSGLPQASYRFDSTPVAYELAGADAVGTVNTLARAGLVQQAAGLLDGALQLTAEYIRGREQFGRRLAEFQAVAQQIADVFVAARMIDLAADEVTRRLATGQPADDDLAIAAYAVCDRLLPALQTCHHLHGGMGVDETYPLHRYFARAHDVVRLLGGPAATRGAVAVEQPGEKNLELTDSQRDFKARARAYFAGLVSRDDRIEMYSDRHGEAYHRTIKQMGADGWMGVGWPKEYGGHGLGGVEQQIFANEASYGDVHLPSVTLQTVGPTLQAFGTEKQKEMFLGRILAGDVHFAIGYSEADAGTDLASLRCAAKKDPATGDWIVNGQKLWTTGGHAADYIWLAVRTDPDAPKHKGISVLIVDTRDPGYSWTPIITSDGSHHVNATYFNDVRVPADMLVGTENEGWKLITTQLNHERVMLGPAGRLEGLRDMVVSWAQHRSTAQGHPVLDDPDVRATLAEVTTAFRLNELLNWSVASGVRSGVEAVADASASKVFASDEVQRHGLALLDVVTAHGDPADPETAYLIDYLDRTSKRNLVLTFGGGVNEVQRELIAMFGLGLPKVPR